MAEDGSRFVRIKSSQHGRACGSILQRDRYVAERGDRLLRPARYQLAVLAAGDQKLKVFDFGSRALLWAGRDLPAS